MRHSGEGQPWERAPGWVGAKCQGCQHVRNTHLALFLLPLQGGGGRRYGAGTGQAAVFSGALGSEGIAQAAWEDSCYFDFQPCVIS